MNPAIWGIACSPTSANIQWQPINCGGISGGIGVVTKSDTPKMHSGTVIRSAKPKEKSDNLMDDAGIHSAYISNPKPIQFWADLESFVVSCLPSY